MNRIVLRGCTPEPLASYLKALAILRLVSEQKDPGARGWWEDDRFCLESSLDTAELVRFFLGEYSPTPIVAPWNGGSGFYEGDDTSGRDTLRASTAPRFQSYRETIESILRWSELPATDQSLKRMLDLVESAAAEKKGKARDDLLSPVLETRRALDHARGHLPADPLTLSIGQLKAVLREVRDRAGPVKELIKSATKVRTIVKKLSRAAGKAAIVQACRDRLDARVVEWIDAAVGLGPEGELAYPPLLGTAGSEGRLDYTNAFMQRIADLLLVPEKDGIARALLENAIFGTSCEGLVVASVGQHDPGRAGGYNQGPGIESKEFPTNPWTFVFALEGSLVWASGVARRQGQARGPFLSSPFTVAARAVGHASSAKTDEVKARAEVWTPLWARPIAYPELRAFLSEGRADLGRRRATHGIEFAEAVSALGIDRGITGFVRYSLLKRRGDSYVALPTGRFAARARSETDLLRELDAILGKFDRFMRAFRGKDLEPPARFATARRNVDAAIYALLLHGGPNRMLALVAALGALERLVAERDRAKDPKISSPLGGLSPRWILAADDGTNVEVRLAAALASIGRTDDVGPLRANLAPVDPARPWKWATQDAQMAWSGSSLAARLAGALGRRMIDAARLRCRENPLRGAIPLHPEDAIALAAGDIDEGLLEDLLFGFSWIKWERSGDVEALRDSLRPRWALPVARRIVPSAYALLKLLFWPGPLHGPHGQEIAIRPEPAILPLLRGSRVGEACEIAERRLFAAGLAPPRCRFSSSEDGVRLAASLLVPVRSSRALASKVLVTDHSES